MGKIGKIGAVAVVGGGIAGIQATLDLVELGFKVYLIESGPSIGGRMAQLDKTFPTLDCSMCILSPKLVEVARHPNVELLSFSELISVSGSAGNFHLEVVKKTRYVDEEKCTGCGECAKHCPVEIIDDFNAGTCGTKNIYIPFPQASPLLAVRSSETCIHCGVCQLVCEAEAIDFNLKEEVITIDVGSIILAPGFEPFDPSVLKRYKLDNPDVVTSLQFERLECASGPLEGHLIRPSDGKKPKKIGFIQCVGSRDTSGLGGTICCSSVCCVYATKEAIVVKEHIPDVEIYIFVMDLRAFGKGFEEFITRAEKEYKINYIRSRVPEIIEEEGKLAVKYEDVRTNKIKQIDLDFIVLSVGLLPSKSVKKLSETCGVALDDYGYFHKTIQHPIETNVPGIYVCGAAGGPIDIPDSVAQASGAAVKASGLLASERGTLVAKEEYPAEKEIGEEIRIGAFICDCGINIGGIVNVPEVVEYTKALPNVVFVDRNKYTCSKEGNEIIKKAIKEQDLNRVVVASCTPRTHEPLFQNTCREAGLNPFLFEMANIRDQCSWVHMNEPEKATKKACDLVRGVISKSRFLTPLAKQKVPVIQKALVLGGGVSGMTAALDIAYQGIPVYLVEREKELGGFLRKITTLQDGTKASDILDAITKKIQKNGLLQVFTGAELRSVEGYVGNFKGEIGGDGFSREIEFGAAIIATGAQDFKPDGMYDYGKRKNVVTQLELEKILSDSMPGDLKSVVMLQCVGARNEERPYCSRICCIEAVKNALTIKERSPSTEVFVLYRDLRTYGVWEDLYRKARESGVLFIRYEEEKLPIFEDGIITVYDSLLNDEIQIKPDYLVLSTPMVANEGNERINRMFKVPLDENRFFLEAHVKLRPLDFATSGVFLCGTAHAPKLIDESIVQASGAASRACTILSRKEIETEGIVAIVDEEMCIGCGTCVAICPYKAMEFSEERRAYPSSNFQMVVKNINIACKGCGTCAAECPAGAINLGHYEDDQILAQIEGILGA